MHDRTKSIGGTDISAIVGMNPFKSAFDVWLEKTGQSVPKEETLQMKLGKLMEPIVVELYDEQRDQKDGDIRNTKKVYVSHTRDWQTGTPDRLILGIPYNGFEAKTTSSYNASEWADGAVPPAYQLQCHWYMNILDSEWWDIGCLIGNQSFVCTRLYRDKELEAELVTAGERFWQENVLKEIPPDGNDEKYLRFKYNTATENVVPATSVACQWANNLAEIREQLEYWTGQQEIAQNGLKREIGYDEGVEGARFRATWKFNKKGSRVFRFTYKN